MKFGFSKRTCGFSTAVTIDSRSLLGGTFLPGSRSPSQPLIAGQARRGGIITQPVTHLHYRQSNLCVSKKNVVYLQEEVRIAVASGQWFPGLPGTLQIEEEECNFCNTKPDIFKADSTY